MKVLAIETATAACSVALIENGVVVDAIHEVVGRGHAERLLPMIAALRDGGRADAIRVDVGPGSFTGIRVGVAAARALGFAWGIPVTGFASLALIAAIDGGRSDTSVAIEGGHGELFVARYGGSTEDFLPVSMPFDAAVAAVPTARIIGNAAARVVATRGWGEAVAVDPDARAVAQLPAETLPLSLLRATGRRRPDGRSAVTIEETGVEGLDDAMAVMLAAFDPSFGEAWNRAQCLGVLAMPGAVLLVARDGDQPLGFALVRVVIDEAELMLLAVMPEARGRGIGRQLLQESMSCAAARGANTYFLEVRNDNPAVKLYSEEGLSCVGYRKDYYRGNDGKRRDAMTFRRTLI